MEAPNTLEAWEQEVAACQKIIEYKDHQRASTWFRTGMLANFVHMNVKMSRLKRTMRRLFRLTAKHEDGGMTIVGGSDVTDEDLFTDDDYERLLSDARDLINYTLFMLACYRHKRVGWEDWN